MVNEPFKLARKAQIFKPDTKRFGRLFFGVWIYHFGAEIHAGVVGNLERPGNLERLQIS